MEHGNVKKKRTKRTNKEKETISISDELFSS